MKRFSFFIAALFVISGVVMAEKGDKDPKVRAERITERMVTKYSLTEAQRAQLHEANVMLTEKSHALNSEAAKVAKAAKAEKEKEVKKAQKAKKASDKEAKKAFKQATKEVEKHNHKEMDEVRKTYEEQLKSILTPEQFKDYKKNSKKQD